MMVSLGSLIWLLLWLSWNRLFWKPCASYGLTNRAYVDYGIVEGNLVAAGNDELELRALPQTHRGCKGLEERVVPHPLEHLHDMREQ